MTDKGFYAVVLMFVIAFLAIIGIFIYKGVPHPKPAILSDKQIDVPDPRWKNYYGTMVQIIELDGHRFVLAVDHTHVAICEVTDASVIDKK